jgi:hypothetical protein
MKHEEQNLQTACVKWLELQYPKIKRIQSSTDHKTTLIQGALKKRMGYQKGTPDLQILVANHSYHALFVEFKTEKGKQTIEQKDFEKYCNENDYCYLICRNVEGFIQFVKSYINN